MTGTSQPQTQTDSKKLYLNNSAPVVYAGLMTTAQEPEGQCVYISNVPFDHDDWDKQHLMLKEASHGMGMRGLAAPLVRDVMRNILVAAGVNVVME